MRNNQSNRFQKIYCRVAHVLILLLLLSVRSYDGVASPTNTDSLTNVGTLFLESEFESSLNQLEITSVAILSDPIELPTTDEDDSVSYHRTQAAEQDAEVTRRGALISSLNSLSLLELPVGLIKDVGPIRYTVVFSRANITPHGAVLEAYMMFEIPETGDKIAFRGTNIPFSNDGGFEGVGRLELIGSYPIISNQHTLLTILGKGNTFVEFDCNGFKGIGLEAKVEFSRDIIVPEDENGVIKPDGRVETTFTTYAQSWNDFLLGVTLPSFQVRGLEGFSFTVSDAYLDWSDMANPSGIVFPERYPSTYITSGEPQLWRGIYISSVNVKLPPSFQKRNNTNRIGLTVRDMIIDDLGVSGKMSVQNVMSDGDMNGWTYTIDDLGVEITTNEITSFSLMGKLTVPRIVDEKGEAAKFEYAAHRSAEGNYVFAVTLRSSVEMPSLLAKLNLDPGSTLIVNERENRFYPTATLNGTIEIAGVNNGIDLNIPNIRFEALRISTENPEFDFGAIGLGGEEQKSISKYPIVISEIGLKNDGSSRFGLQFNIAINIGGAPKDDGFSGSGTLTVWSARADSPLEDEEGNVAGSEDNWKLDKVELSGISISIEKPKVFKLAGSLVLFSKDPVYGEGFKGTIAGEISGVNVKAYALFGRTSEYRYWFADALVTLETGVPLVPGVLFANAFGGGYYHKMRQSTESIASTLGLGSSGVVYVPDEQSRGVRAIMKIGTARPEAVNGDIALAIEMNGHGGINSMTLSGNANFMSLASLAEDQLKELLQSAATGKLTEKLSALIKGQVYGSMELRFDNINNVFHGNLEVYVNVAGGLVRGVSSGNKAGWAVMHFEQGNWYVLIGTPDQPLGLEVAKIIKTKSYFMIGQNLPGSPPPPSQVTEILGDVDLDYMRDMNALQSGSGIAFGMHFLVDTGDLTFLMFYGRFAAGTGIDFMMKDYGNATCSAANGRVGINGWYANGQAYAFVMGKIGINVNLRFYKGKYEILNIGAAAILQAKGPNPFWMQGTVGGYYKILGGLVKGKCKFKMTIGEECTPSSNGAASTDAILADMTIISEMTPQKGAVQVDVFNTPQVAFNVAIGKEFQITDATGRKRTFRSVLDYFVVKDGSKNLPGELRWNDESDVVVFDGRDVLPSEKLISAEVKIGFEENHDGAWNRISAGDEHASYSFTTSKAPQFIPDHNVLFAYPIKGQVNFFPEEHNEGIIQLKDGQPDLFDSQEGWITKIRWLSPYNDIMHESELTYNSSERRIYFDIHKGINKEAIYKLNITRLPSENSRIDENAQKVSSVLGGSEDANDTLTINTIEGEISQRDETIIYSSFFRTSMYKTFAEKMKDLEPTNTVRSERGYTAFALFGRIKGAESFDAFEVSETNPYRFIKMEAVLEDNEWFEDHANPTVYSGYPIHDMLKIEKRLPEVLGVPPVRDIYFDYMDKTISISEGMTQFKFSPLTYESIVYNLGESVDSDYEELQLKAVNYFIDRPSEITPRIRSLVADPAPYIRYGRYRIKLTYTIPGLDVTTSSYQWELFNDIKDHSN